MHRIISKIRSSLFIVLIAGILNLAIESSGSSQCSASLDTICPPLSFDNCGNSNIIPSDNFQACCSNMGYEYESSCAWNGITGKCHALCSD